jgi:MipA family protein
VPRQSNTLLPFVLATVFLLTGVASQAVFAETPALRMMPDGSRDLYAGIALNSAPEYAGAAERKTRAMALIQMQWSSGIFLSGLSAGWHLSDSPQLEYGPLLAIEPGRTASGNRSLSGAGGISSPTFGAPGSAAAPGGATQPALQVARFEEVSSRLTAGGFFNYYFNQQLRMTGSLLYGAGNDQNGLLFNTAIQQSFANLPAHHHVSISAGANWANRHYLHSFFGTEATRLASGATSLAYAPSSGLRDVQLSVNWNWELSRPLLLTSQLNASRLMGEAADSPLVSRRNLVGARVGLAYRF